MLEQLYPLALLACPIGMGLMIWMMMRSKKPHAPSSTESSANELARLRAEVDQLRAEQQHNTDRRQQTEPDYR